MKIAIKDESAGEVKIPVTVKHNIWGIATEELAETLKLREELVNLHYQVTSEAHDVDDIDEMDDYIAERVAEYAGEDLDYSDIAKELLDAVRDDVVNDIMELDDDAIEYSTSKKGL